jgi:hypothetical protein
MVLMKTSHLIYGDAEPSLQTDRGESPVETIRNSIEEVVMSCMASASVEVNGLTMENAGCRKPVLVRARREDCADQVMRRVAEVVDAELANGSMPA